MTRNKIGRFDSFKAKVSRTIKQLLVAMTLVAMGAGAYAMSMPATITATTPEIIDNTPKKIEQLRKDLVTTLMNCERGGRTEADGLITIDNNSRGTLTGDDILSYGLLQFKTKTVQRFVKFRDAKDITALDAKLLALDSEQAQSLAQYAIFEKGAINEWYNCSVKYNLAAEVAIIKKLSK